MAAASPHTGLQGLSSSVSLAQVWGHVYVERGGWWPAWQISGLYGPCGLRFIMPRTDVGKCTHWHNDKQGNSSTRALSTDNKEDRQQKKKEGRLLLVCPLLCCLLFLSIFLHPEKTIFVESTRVLFFPCFSLY